MSKKRVTIKDISATLGVSYGIIYRALNNKPGVSPETREKILDKAKELGYRANKVARSMARATITIGVVAPESDLPYHRSLARGIREELDRLSDYNIEAKFFVVGTEAGFPTADRALLSCLEDGVSGVILADVFSEEPRSALTALSKESIPVITIGSTESTESHTLASVRTDAYASGKMAARMLSLCLPEGARAAIFVGDVNNAEHKEKIRGFTDGLSARGIDVARVCESHDDESEATGLLKNLAESGELPEGIYFATSGTSEAIESLISGPFDIKIVSTDPDEKTARQLRGDKLICSIFQAPERQGRLAVRAMYEYLSNGVRPSDIILVSPSPIIDGGAENI